MDKANPLSTPMVVRTLNVEKDPFRPCEDNEDIVGPKVPYLSAIGTLMYLANCTRPDIAFAVNLLARFSSSPTRRHWNGIKHIFRYLQGTIDLGLFYPNESKKGLVGYVDAGHLSDPHKARSQTGYVFTCGGTAISWRSQKQTLVATSSNHAEVIALHETKEKSTLIQTSLPSSSFFQPRPLLIHLLHSPLTHIHQTRSSSSSTMSTDQTPLITQPTHTATETGTEVYLKSELPELRNL
ncbi:hypothetical protein UlMin_032509 [Ulmus minor]